MYKQTEFENLVRKYAGDQYNSYFSSVTFPAQRYGELTGVKLHEDYILPFSLTDQETQNLMIQFRLLCRAGNEVDQISNAQAIEEYYNELKLLNPQLSVLPCNEIHYKITVAMGAVSKFNVQDIQYYLETGGYYYVPQEFKREIEATELRVGSHMNWVISPSTLKPLTKN